MTGQDWKIAPNLAHILICITNKFKRGTFREYGNEAGVLKCTFPYFVLANINSNYINNM